MYRDFAGPTWSVKKPRRVMYKVEHKYGGDWARVTDVARATVIFTEIEYLVEATRFLLKQPNMCGYKNRYATPTPEQYHDMLFNFLTAAAAGLKVTLSVRQSVTKTQMNRLGALYEGKLLRIQFQTNAPLRESTYQITDRWRNQVITRQRDQLKVDKERSIQIELVKRLTRGLKARVTWISPRLRLSPVIRFCRCRPLGIICPGGLQQVPSPPG